MKLLFRNAFYGLTLILALFSCKREFDTLTPDIRIYVPNLYSVDTIDIPVNTNMHFLPLPKIRS
ncbi:MAG: hypothetical protein HC905_23270 [Bacteroidales bacterium]|nr:hypothetical protein [Bacteroidales bacterium]